MGNSGLGLGIFLKNDSTSTKAIIFKVILMPNMAATDEIFTIK